MDNIEMHFKWGEELWPGSLSLRVGAPENTGVHGNAFWAPKGQEIS